MNNFVCNKIVSNLAYLIDEEAFHCHKVMRKDKGQLINLIDGKGTFYQGVLMESSKTKCIVEIQKEWREDPKAYRLHVAIAPTKNMSRFEWFIEKAIEIGIDEISPVICDHSERKSLKLERIGRIATGAVKQSLRATIPILNEPVPLNEFLSSTNETNKIVAHLHPEAKHLKKMLVPQKPYVILIGPEGDFSQEELNLIKKQKWMMAILGKNRLRTETAGVVACQILSGIHY